MKSQTKTILLGAGLILLVTLTAYIPVMRAGYIWDDELHVTRNPNLRTGEGLWRIWFDVGAVPQYYPLVHTSFWMEYHLWQLHPLGYHLVNILLHGLNAVLIWALLRRLSVPGALLAACLFALHPVHVESVAWITERKNVLSGFFYLSALLAYLGFSRMTHEPVASPGVEGGSSPSGSQSRRRVCYLLALFLYLCALLSKTIACSLPVTILLLLWWKKDRIHWRDLPPLLPFFVVGAALGLLTVWMEKHLVGAQGEAWALSLVDRCLIAGRALWFYAGKLLWPRNLIFIYPRWPVNSGIWWQYLFPVTAGAVLALLWFMRRRTGKGPLVTLLYFAVTLVPALGFFNVYPMQFSFVADHFQYLASIGVIALVSAWISVALNRLPSPRRAYGHAICLGVLLVFAVQIWHLGRSYINIETLWRDTIAKNPDAWLAHNNLGTELYDRGSLDEAIYQYSEALRSNPTYALAHNNLGAALENKGRLDEAIDHYRQALRIQPDYADAHTNLGTALARQGKLGEAISHYAQALQIEPADPRAHNNLAGALLDMGRFDEALDHFRQALRIQPDCVEAHNNLGTVLIAKGKVDEAILHYTEALRIRPGYADAHYNLAGALTAKGKLDEAMEHYCEMLRSKPDHAGAHAELAVILKRRGRTVEAIEHYQQALRLKPDWPEVLNNLAWIFATAAEPKLRNAAKALDLAQNACRLTGHKEAGPMDTLAAAYAEAARFHEAVQTAHKARDLALANGRLELADVIEQHLQGYKAGKPYHEEATTHALSTKDHGTGSACPDRP
jgi:tetratricopeptide (TPR) repeat protein